MAHSFADHPDFLARWPLALPYLTEIVGIEAELSTIWPGWKRRTQSLVYHLESRKDFGALADALAESPVGDIVGEPFGAYPMERQARIKYLLKRESLLRRGEGEWYVMIAYNATRTACYAHPHPGPPPPTWAPPPRVGEAPAPRPVAPSASALAYGLRLPLERVEAALLAGATTPEAVREFVGRP